MANKYVELQNEKGETKRYQQAAFIKSDRLI